MCFAIVGCDSGNSSILSQSIDTKKGILYHLGNLPLTHISEEKDQDQNIPGEPEADNASVDSIADAPDTTDAAEKPSNPEHLEAAKDSENPENPENLEHSQSAESLDAPEHPEAAENADAIATSSSVPSDPSAASAALAAPAMPAAPINAAEGETKQEDAIPAEEAECLPDDKRDVPAAAPLPTELTVLSTAPRDNIVRWVRFRFFHAQRDLAPRKPRARHAAARTDPGVPQRVRGVPRHGRGAAGRAVLLQLLGAVPGGVVGSAGDAAAGGGAGPLGARDQHLGQLGAVLRGAGARGRGAVHGIQPESAEHSLHWRTRRRRHALARVQTRNGGREDRAGAHALVGQRGGVKRRVTSVHFNPLHDALLLTSSTDSSISLWRLFSVSSSRMKEKCARKGGDDA